MKQTYTVAIGLGFDCKCSQSLRRAGLQFRSYPFDWVTGASLESRIRLLTTEFAAWPGPESLRDLGTEATDRFAEAHRVVRDPQTGLEFRHDFPTELSVADGYPAVREKYDRRKARMLREIQEAETVLLVFLQGLGTPLPSLSEGQTVYEILSRKFGRKCTLLLVGDDDPDHPDHPIRKDSAEDGHLLRWSLPCIQHTSLGDTVKDHAIAEALRNAFHVPDPRTAKEKRDYARLERTRKMAKYKARTPMGMIWNQLQFRLYRKLQKALRRKGIIPPAPPRAPQ